MSIYHLCSCPEPDTFASGSAGSGCGWSGRSGSSSGGNTSTWRCSADCGGRSPAPEERTHHSIRHATKDGWTLEQVAKVLCFLYIDPHLAAFAGNDSIVDPGGLVPADLAGDDLDLSCMDNNYKSGSCVAVC